MAVCRPNLLLGLMGLFISLVTAVFINIFRIMTLAIGIAYPEIVFGVDVMSEPGHSVLGLIALSMGCLPILYWARFAKENFTLNKPISRLSLRGAGGDAANQFAHPAGLPRWLQYLLLFLIPSLAISAESGAVFYFKTVGAVEAKMAR